MTNADYSSLLTFLRNVRQSEYVADQMLDAECDRLIKLVADCLAEPPQEPERYACYLCSNAAGVLLDTTKHITHRVGEPCPLAPKEQP